MTAQTSRYKLTYPTGSDLVSGAPSQFKSMADSVEKALGEVDDRQTANAVKPVVRTTLAQLAEAAGVTGQTGYVTADSVQSNNGAYVYTGSAWVKNVGTWQKFTFKFENEGSFQPIPFSGDNELLWNPILRLIVVRLASFRSIVGVSTYTVYLSHSGTFKPSKNIGLGQAEFENFTGRGIEVTLTTMGSITIGPELTSGDVVRHLGSYVVPVPSGVTITASGGTSI